MADLILKQKDKGKVITFTCVEPVYVDGVWDGKTTTPKDLSGLTITAKWWIQGNPATPVVTAVCTAVGDPTLGVCQAMLTGTDFTAAEFLMMELEYTLGSTIVDSSQTYTTQVLESP